MPRLRLPLVLLLTARSRVLLVLLWCLAGPAWAVHPIPAFAEVRAGARPSVAVLLARDGTPISERRLDMTVRRLEWVGLNSLSPALKEALLAAEDKRFFEHSGVDWRAFAGSLWHNLWYERKRGASTLSMQLAGLLDPELALGRSGMPRRSIGQKWDQAFAAQALEARWTKEQILEAYLNLAPFRSDLQGVHAASRALFNKTPAELGRPEALILAVLLRGPNARPEVVGRRACVLAERVGAPAACAQVQRLAQSSLDRPAAPRWDMAPHAARLLLTHPGERLVTTLDGELQRSLLAALRKPGVGEQAAGVVVDNLSGDILAYVGALDGAQTDQAQAPRPVGSLIQPFVYGLAIERRLVTAASFLEEPLANHAPTTPDERMWVSVRRALAESMSDPAANLMRLLGEGLVERLRLAEVEGGRGGVPDLGLMQLAGLYRSLASGGQWLLPRWLPASGERPARRLLRPEAAFIVSDVLVEPDEDGAGLPFVYRQFSPDARDSVTVGFSERYTLALWISGSRSSALVAGQVWHEMMRGLHRAAPPLRPVPPPGVVSSLVVFEPPLENARREWFVRGTETDRVSPPRSLARISHPLNGVLVDAMAIVDDPGFRVMLDAVHAPPGAWWRLNGERLAGSNGLRTAWRPVAGRHVLELVSLEGVVLDSVIFAVRAPLE
ncbi:transglycosylase domain-containing protein [Zoogloea dura]|uniref:peptidoglycan glycosyltransferase n=1 Tax=Zoogloea dura TaxID=2728840 RepID=A0A848G229_9RHOO|nr:transglycosylase domain-containing protein [Zoogloea dura]NML26257.1 penicillin-binding protein 1C [Zoogloea dura]